MDDTMQRDTDNGFFAWLLDNPEELAILLSL
jgi:hypothetical protein